MRKFFADYTLNAMQKNDKIWVVTGDLGFKMWDKVKETFPDRFLNVGSAEQLMVDVGIGLALNGCIPILYSITPFLLYRGFESIRTYINHENLNVKLVGSGRDRDYAHDGISHWGEDDADIMGCLKNIKVLKPEKLDSKFLEEEVMDYFGPVYLNLRR